MTPRGKAQLSFALEASYEQPALMVDRLVEGVISGGLVGPAQAIKRRDSDGLVFISQMHGGSLSDHGEIRIKTIEEGISLDIRLWCASARRRCLFSSALIGGLAATVGTLAFGWLIVFSALLSALVAIGAYLWMWRRCRKRLRCRMETFVANTAYIRSQ